jgi:hypothetical protein
VGKSGKSVMKASGQTTAPTTAAAFRVAATDVAIVSAVRTLEAHAP